MAAGSLDVAGAGGFGGGGGAGWIEMDDRRAGGTLGGGATATGAAMGVVGGLSARTLVEENASACSLEQKYQFWIAEKRIRGARMTSTDLPHVAQGTNRGDRSM
jgi:hypothetical protein